MATAKSASRAPQNNNKPITKTWCIDIKSIYSKHFPTDKRSFNVRISLVGLCLSVLAWNYILTAGQYLFNPNIKEPLILLFYVIASCGTNFELYYGLSIGDRKQLTPWLLQKLCEIPLILAGIIYLGVDKEDFASVIFGVVILVPEIIVLYVIGNKSCRQFRGPNNNHHIDDENIYDNYEDV